MNIRILKTPEDFACYDVWVKSHPHGSLWQSLEWKRYQETLGREVRVYVGEGEGNILASALVVIDRTTGGFSTWDVPRGHLWLASSFQLLALRNVVHALLDTIIRDAREDYCLALYLSPPSPLDIAKSYPFGELRAGQLEASPRHERPEATRIIDLTKSEEEILAQMHQKGRYNIKVAQKNCVRVEQSHDVEAFYELLRETAKRDGFQTLPLKAYRAFLECLPGSFLLLAHERSHKPIAGLLGTTWNRTGLYYYGASDYTYRTLMAPYALQWEAMRLCKAKGCAQYDLLGVMPPSPLTLALSPSFAKAPAGRRGEREFLHPWAGVSTFKEKLGGTVMTYPPEQQIVLRPLLWKLLQWKRKVFG